MFLCLNKLVGHADTELEQFLTIISSDHGPHASLQLTRTFLLQVQQF